MAYSSDLTRTKDWGTEILTDSDLEGQFDLIINWVMASMNSSTGHDHSGTSNKGPKVYLSGATIGVQGTLGATLGGTGLTSFTLGDVIYSSAANTLSKLAGNTTTTAKALVQTGDGAASAAPAWTEITSTRKIGSLTRDLTASTGSVATTGVGFTPRLLFVLFNQDNNLRFGIGFTDGTSKFCAYASDTSWKFRNTASYLIQSNDTSAYQQADIASLDSDGFTLSWTKTGSPTGTLTIYYLAIR